MVLCIAALAAAPCFAGSLEEQFLQGNAAFERGDWKEAVRQYRALENLGVRSSMLFYNRGTAEARLGHPGMAAYYFERVLAMEPGHDDAAHNLQVVRDFIARRANEHGRDADLMPAAGPWRATLDRFSPASASVSFLVFYLLFFAALLARRFLRGDLLRLSAGVVAGIFATLALLLGTVTMGKRHQVMSVKDAVVVSAVDGDQLNVFEGPGSQVRRFGLEEGARVQVLEHRRGWTKVRDDQGRDGWVAAGHIRRI